MKTVIYKYSRKELINDLNNGLWQELTETGLRNKVSELKHKLLSTLPPEEHAYKKILTKKQVRELVEIVKKQRKEPDAIDSIDVETDFSTGKKYMAGLKLNQVDEFLVNKINLMIFFINSLAK